MSARLVGVRTPRDPEGVVIVLHGGAQREGNPMVSPTQLSVIRMIPVARRIARSGSRRRSGGLAVLRLLNTHRGWDMSHTPVDDVAWAMTQVRERWPGVPVALVGHSLGGRAALLAGEQDGVEVVVALNPWVYAGDDSTLDERQVLFVHGDADRIAPLARSRAVAERLARRTEVGFVTVTGGKHAMLRHGRVFEEAAADFVVARLLGAHVASGPIAQVLGGETWVTV